MQTTLDSTYWDNRWNHAQTPWDIGAAAPALMAYMEQIADKHLDILIPGCGNAYEAAQLSAMGFKNITLIDIAPSLTQSLQERFEEDANIRVICGDFFMHQGQYDIILEQTFFCALEPTLRAAYAARVQELLKPDGRLVGVLFNRTFEQSGPPFGGSKEEYLQYFRPLFHIHKMEQCYNSIGPRAGYELFINLQKKKL